MLGQRYLFCAAPLYPVSVVAVEGGANDWAAYIAGLPIYAEPLPEYLQRVYREGAKFTEAEARGFFPGIELAYRA